MQVPFTRSSFRHPLATHSALDVLGYRRNGAPIYAIAGGSGEGEGGSDSGGQSGSGESGQSGQGDGGGSGQSADQGGQQSGKESGQSGSDSGDGGTDWKTHAREWEKRAKANAKAAEEGAKAAAELEKIREQNMSAQEKAVAAAEKAGRTAAEKESAAEVEKLNGQLRELTIRDAVRDRAEKHGAKATALLDSLSFRTRIADLDPTAKTFGANLDDAIKAVVKDNPGTFAAQAAGKSGGDLSGGTGEGNAKKRSTSLSGAVGAHYQT